METRCAEGSSEHIDTSGLIDFVNTMIKMNKQYKTALEIKSLQRIILAMSMGSYFSR